MLPKKLITLPFVDLYICVEGDAAPHYRAPAEGVKKHPQIALGPEYKSDIDRLTHHIKQNTGEEWTMIDFDGIRMRAVFIHTANQQKWVALRKVKSMPPALASLGFPPGFVTQLQALGKQEGLILVCGATGQGKTTTCCSLLVDYMTRYGGVGFTIEDPVEYSLAGPHGDSGFCFQVEVHEDHEWADQLRLSLRCHPRYIFIGEICTPDAANQLLRAATSGHLVIATVHAGSLNEGLEGILHLAEEFIGDRAKQLLASSITAVIHQSIGQYGLMSRFVVAGHSNQAAALRTLIRESQIGQIGSIADQQFAQMCQKEHVSA